MFKLLDWTNLIAGAALGLIIGTTAGYQLGHFNGEREGRALERTAAVERSLDLIRDRSKTNAEIRSLDRAALCRELGGRMLSDGTCE